MIKTALLLSAALCLTLTACATRQQHAPRYANPYEGQPGVPQRTFYEEREENGIVNQREIGQRTQNTALGVYETWLNRITGR